ncbi:MAG TPA: hypothetical protein VGH27_30795 [Streptosporangiaceae bacterium]|jgi:hypothetical protein
MVIALIVLALIVAASTLGMLALVAAAIRSEAPRTELNGQAPNPVATVVRRMLGVHVIKPGPEQRREAWPSGRATGRRHEGW